MSHRRPRGRPTSSTRLRREDCAALPVRMLPNLPALPHPYPVIEMSFGGDIDGLPIRITLRLIRTAHAWLCLCPRCGWRAAVLYFPPGSTAPGCRACLGLVYESQYDYTLERVFAARALAEWSDLGREHFLGS